MLFLAWQCFYNHWPLHNLAKLCRHQGLALAHAQYTFDQVKSEWPEVACRKYPFRILPLFNQIRTLHSFSGLVPS